MKKKIENLPTSDGNLEGDIRRKTLRKTEKKILIISSIAVLLTFIIGASYAYIAYTTRQESINVLETDCIKVTMEELTNAINLRNAYPVTDEVGALTKPFRFKLENTCGVGVDYNLNLEVKESENRIAAKNIAVKVDANVKNILGDNPRAEATINESDFIGVESYTTYSGILKPYESVTHEIRIWLDESAGNDSQNGTFFSKVVIEAIQNQVTIAKFNDYILGQMEVDSSIEKFEHEETHQTQALTDYRYTGANPNNYVYFGCEDNCTEENLYRIIGVMPTQSEIGKDKPYENRVKLIKAAKYTENESGYLKQEDGYWGNATNNNNWEESTINLEVLNNVYWNNLEEYQKYIAESVWYLGAGNHNVQSTYTSPDFYNYERSNQVGISKGSLNYAGNIGLMYPSDYGFSLGSQYAKENMTQNSNLYVTDSWMYKYSEWTITPESSLNFPSSLHPTQWKHFYLIRKTGNSDDGACFSTNINNSANIRPTFYLKSNVLCIGGEEQ